MGSPHAEEVGEVMWPSPPHFFCLSDFLFWWPKPAGHLLLLWLTPHLDSESEVPVHWFRQATRLPLGNTTSLSAWATLVTSRHTCLPIPMKV